MIGWVDASCGASGDMLLGALLGAGVPLDVVSAAVSSVAPEPVTLSAVQVTRNGFAATRCHVELPTRPEEPRDEASRRADSTAHRNWSDVKHLLAAAELSEPVRSRAHATFDRLARAEAAVHGTSPDDVHFHEVGALDAIADVVGVCAGIEHLGLDELVVSRVAVGSGSVSGAHGSMPVPVPAVVELLREVASYAGPGGGELCTPTGAALLTGNATSYGAQPAMTVHQVGIGAGARDPGTHANVLRLLLGSKSDEPSAPTDALLLATNVDDLDPRLWPNVISTLLAAGASDAWLTPIVMKKGRPAHTLTALVTTEHADAVRAEIFRQTSTIGLREQPVAKTALRRVMRDVTLDGHRVRVKLAMHDGAVVNAQPEYDDVAAVAAATSRPVKDVLADAVAASRHLIP